MCAIVMRWGYAKTLSVCAVLLLILTSSALTSTKRFKGTLSNTSFREQKVESLAKKAVTERDYAHRIARQKGWRIKGRHNKISYELMHISSAGKPIYNRTCNVNSAISHGVDMVRNTSPYNLNGAGLTVGVWDAGDVRSTHQEFGSRVTVFDSAGSHDHSTHVAGTIAAAGTDAAALGMAPSANIDSYDWNFDASETASRAASFPAEPGKIYVSNHSYGIATGWETGDYSGNTGPHWFGVWNEREDQSFGRYSSDAPAFDSTCYSAQYYLPFWAAGNDRNDNAPGNGTTFYYSSGGWQSKSYDSATDPYDDFFDAGYDTIMPTSTAKNIMTVGAVNDAVSGGVRNLSNGTMTSFSGWGPTDDGRIKPDIVCNGASLYSPTAVNNSSYANFSGTSMATPSAAGAAILLAEYYGNLFSGGAMLASTLKGLIIHTADDLGNPGPDYSYGWGLVNAQAAAIQITQKLENPNQTIIAEGIVNTGSPTASYPFTWDGVSPIRITLCWTDPAAGAVSGLDNTAKRLVNDLDLRISGPNSTTYYPFVLDPANPSNNATTGDNDTDNVEQVYIAAPTEAGTYTAQISYKGTLTNSQQNFSIIITGQAITSVNHFEWSSIPSPQDVNIPFGVVLTAKSFDGNTATDFNDTVSLTGWTGYDNIQQEIGSGTIAGEFPISVRYKKRRTQMIYLASDIAQSGTINALGLDVIEVPGLTRNNWTIRMMHTADSEFATADWVSAGWTTVYVNNELPGSIGWQYYNFTTPFVYDGVSNLMIDFSLDNTSLGSVYGKTNTTSISTNRRITYITNSGGVGAPTSWSGTNPQGTLAQWQPNIRLVFAGTKVSIGIEPNETGNFVNGIWSGDITVLQQAFDMYLRAGDPNDTISDSNLFDAVLLPFEPNTPSPAAGANDVPVDTILSWTGGSGSLCGVTYDVYIDTNNPPTTLVCADVNTTSCDPVLMCSTTYYWKVLAKNCHGNSAGQVWTFDTESLLGDFDTNCSVDFYDYASLSNYWLTNEPSVDIAPPAGDGIINHLDLEAFTNNWLSELFE